MKIDLDKLSDQELRHLNHEIVFRLQVITSIRRSTALAAFRVGGESHPVPCRRLRKV